MDIQKAEDYVFEKLEENLSDTLFYHGLHHTVDVTNAALQLAVAEGISDKKSLILVQTAALYHDMGFITAYRGHEEESCRLARVSLPDFEYSPEQIDCICGMIMATRIPQNPGSHLEKIIADADLDYLGREDFWSIARSLFEELKERELVTDIDSWNKTQVVFLENHNYWTETARKWRNATKVKHLNELRALTE